MSAGLLCLSLSHTHSLCLYIYANKFSLSLSFFLSFSLFFSLFFSLSVFLSVSRSLSRSLSLSLSVSLCFSLSLSLSIVLSFVFSLVLCLTFSSPLCLFLLFPSLFISRNILFAFSRSLSFALRLSFFLSVSPLLLLARLLAVCFQHALSSPHTHHSNKSISCCHYRTLPPSTPLPLPTLVFSGSVSRCLAIALSPFVALSCPIACSLSLVTIAPTRTHAYTITLRHTRAHSSRPLWL